MYIMVVAEVGKLRSLTNIMMELYPQDIIIPLDDGMSAVQFAFNNQVDAVYTELKAPPITGFDVARLVRQKYPDTSIYLIADTADYVGIAAKKDFDGYYVEPVSVEILQKKNLLAGRRTS